MAAFVIESGIPVPAGKTNGLTATFRAMKVGDSIFVPATIARSGFASTAKAANIKVISRRERDGSRVWRIE